MQQQSSTQPVSSTGGSLTAEQRAAFQRDGFLIAPVFAPADFAGVKTEISAALDRRAREFHAAGMLTELHEDAPFETRFGLLAAQCPDLHGGMDTTDLLGDELFAFMRHPKMLAALASLLGPELTLNPIQHLRAKPPGVADRARAGYYEVPWHQDSGVTTPDSDAALLITAWTPLCGANEEMGCMRLIPGFHSQGHVDHISDPRYGTTIRPELVPEERAVAGICNVGDVVFMTQFTPHSSTVNRSQFCRWSIDLRYQANGTASGRAWYPSTVLQSRRDPASEVHDAAVWRASWKDAAARPNPGAKHRIAV